MEFIAKAMGHTVVATKFERMGLAALNARPAMELTALEMLRIIRLNFESEGRRGGGSWRKDTQEWLLRKFRMGLDPRINRATRALYDSFAFPGAPNQQLVITDHSVILGSNLPYAGYVQRERPFVKYTERDRLRLRAIIRDHLMAAYRA